MSADPAATANVLGAVALAVADQLAAGGRPDSAAATLSALYHFSGDLTVDRLAQVAGVTHSGAVRVVDRLASAGLAERAPGTDRRSRSVHLTAAGRRAARRVSDQRIAYLGSLLAGLSTAEAATLHELLGRVMSQVVHHKEGGAWICRLCDLRACGRAEGTCPAANAAAAKYGLKPDGELSQHGKRMTGTPPSPRTQPPRATIALPCDGRRHPQEPGRRAIQEQRTGGSASGRSSGQRGTKDALNRQQRSVCPRPPDGHHSPRSAMAAVGARTAAVMVGLFV